MDWLKKLENIKKFYQEPGFVLPEPGPTEQDDRIELETYGWDFMSPKSTGPREGSTVHEFKDALTEKLVPELGVSYKSPKGWSVGAGPWAGEGKPSVNFQFRKEFDDGGVATPKRGLVDEPGSYAGFDLDFYKDLETSELNKAAKYYTKGKVTKFKNLAGPEYKTVRRMVNTNLERNKGKFRDPTVSKKDRFEDSYKTIKKFIKKFKNKKGNKTNRLPSKVEIAKGTGFHVQGSIEAGEKKGLFKTYEGRTPEAAKAGAEKRAILQTKTAKTATVPILRKPGPGKPVEQVIFPDKKIGGKSYKKAFIDDLKLRYKYPLMSKEAKAAGVLSDAQMAKKYGIPSQKSLAQYIYYTNKFEKLGTSPIKSSKELLKTSQEYRDVLKAQQGKVFIPRGLHGTVKSGTHLQHAMLKNPKLPITAQNLVFIPARMNTKYVKNIETLRNNITAERDKLLKNKPKDWIKRVETLNNQGIDLAAQTDGIVQFESIDHKGNKYVHKLGSEKYQLDVAGLNEDKLLKDYTKADWDRLRLNVDQSRTAGSKLSSTKIKKLLTDLCPNKAQGGRIGMKVAGTPRVACGSNRFKQVFKNPAKGTKAERQLVGKIVRSAGSAAGRKALYVLGPAGVGIDALIETAVWGDDVLKGSSGEQAYKDHWLSYLDPTAYTGGLKVSGDRYNETEIAKKYKGDTGKFFNLAHAIEDKYRLQNKLRMNEESDIDGFGVSFMGLSPAQQLRLESVNAIINNHGGEERVLSLIKEDSPLFNAAQISSERFEEVGPGKQWDRIFTPKGLSYQDQIQDKRMKKMDTYSTYDQFITPEQYQGMDLEEQAQATNVIPELNLTERANIKESYGIPSTHNLSEYAYTDTGMSLLDEYNQRKKWQTLLNTKGMRGTQDTRYAGGGIAGVRRPNAIAPESGPAPQGEGLSYILNRVREW